MPKTAEELHELLAQVIDMIDMIEGDGQGSAVVDASEALNVDAEALIGNLVPLYAHIAMAINVRDVGDLFQGESNIPKPIRAAICLASIAYLAGVLEGREQKASEPAGPLDAF